MASSLVPFYRITTPVKWFTATSADRKEAGRPVHTVSQPDRNSAQPGKDLRDNRITGEGGNR
ncbi:hypothetical protein GCM10009765_59740 [Fodinicola feengrottensis]|uniref:Uncharacterized protein n=1 Tax=Fodinicola feengrottensis TaxID=435914 RepID=A0ABN2ICF3_9ACTN